MAEREEFAKLAISAESDKIRPIIKRLRISLPKRNGATFRLAWETLDPTLNFPLIEE